MKKRMKRPKYELKIAQADTSTPLGLFRSIARRAEHAIAASQEPDPELREKKLDFIKRGKLWVTKVVPFVARPRTLAEILRTKPFADALRSVISKLRNRTNS